jgi:hypothetical protein
MSSMIDSSRLPEARTLEPPLQLGHEQHVRELRLAVDEVAAVALVPVEVVEADLAVAMRAGGHDHDAVP